MVEETLEYKFLSRKGAEKWGGEEGQPKKLRFCGKPQLNLIIGRLVKRNKTSLKKEPLLMNKSIPRNLYIIKQNPSVNSGPLL